MLEMDGITKYFGNNPALQDARFALQKGEVHGLLGGNGAGKTTLMNILYGLYHPDSGGIYIDSKKVDISSPADAIRNHIGMVHQHFLLVGNFTVTENIALGTKLAKPYLLDLRKEREKIVELSTRFQLEVDPDRKVSELPIGAQQRVEILKALYRGADYLALDEPTTNLTPQEVDSLFGSLRSGVSAGLGIVFITHKIREALAVCDRITVLREGKNVGTVERKDASEDALVQMMVGTQIDPLAKIISFGASNMSRIRGDFGPTFLQVKDLYAMKDKGSQAVKGISFELRNKEILGIAGVSGNGQRELAEALTGVRAVSGGEALFDGRRIDELDAAKLLEMGVVYIPEDRMQDGLLPSLSVSDNLILGGLIVDFGKKWLLDRKQIESVTGQLVKDYSIKAANTSAEASQLSGGNIQRLLIARAFAKRPLLLVAHNPTRGLDIPSSELVYKKMVDAAEAGSGILLVSEDIDEVMLLSDRIMIMYRGENRGILERKDFDRHVIGRMMSGVDR